jgi:hypothetical protein
MKMTLEYTIDNSENSDLKYEANLALNANKLAMFIEEFGSYLREITKYYYDENSIKGSFYDKQEDESYKEVYRGAKDPLEAAEAIRAKYSELMNEEGVYELLNDVE